MIIADYHQEAFLLSVIQLQASSLKIFRERFFSLPSFLLSIILLVLSLLPKSRSPEVAFMKKLKALHFTFGSKSQLQMST